MEETELNRLTERVIGCAIEVHRQLGPGLLESDYEAGMCIELDLAGLAYEHQKPVPVVYINFNTRLLKEGIHRYRM